MKALRIFGAGVRGRMIADLIAWQFAERFRVEGFYDDRMPPGASGPNGLPVFGKVEAGIREAASLRFSAHVALGTRAAAHAVGIFLTLRQAGVEMPALVSPAAHVSPSASSGDNSTVMPGVFVGAAVKFGDMVMAHGGVSIEHNCKLGHNVLLAPGVAIAGFVTIEDHAFLGVGTAVAPSVTIGEGTLVGAGSLVIADLPAHVVAFGRPAMVQRQTRSGDEVVLKDELPLRAGTSR